jgi:hypothetical protein
LDEHGGSGIGLIWQDFKGLAPIGIQHTSTPLGLEFKKHSFLARSRVDSGSDAHLRA